MNIDLHAHFLPKADHGSDGMTTSLTQISLAQVAEVDVLAATPHFYPNVDSVDSFLRRRARCYSALASAMQDGMPCVKLGAEVYICEGIERIPMLDKLLVHGTNTLLLELSSSLQLRESCNSVRALVKSGVNVVLAHPERYSVDYIDSVLEEGALLQINAETVSGLVIPAAVKKWLSAEKVVALGSDVHGTHPRAYASFRKALLRIQDHIDYIKEKTDGIWKLSKDI
jgi:protein-tyrosine phosphatase